jgi:hypothetical protein
MQVRRPGEPATLGEAAEITGLPAHSAHVGAGSRSRDSRCENDPNAAVGCAPLAAVPDAHVGAMSAVDSVDETDARVGEGARKLDAAILRTQAKAALTGLGWKPAIAHAAVVAAAEAQGDAATLERLIFEALRRCPTPTV